MMGNLSLTGSSSTLSAQENGVVSKWLLNFRLSAGDESESTLPVSLHVTHSGSDNSFRAAIVNGPELIDAGKILESPEGARIDFPHFNSSLRFDKNWDAVQKTGTAEGVWRRQRAGGKVVEVPFSVQVYEETGWEDPSEFCGRWEVRFEDETDISVGEFKQDASSRRIQGTFLTTTGDYRYLAGGVIGGRLVLSCFDGSHAFLFHAGFSASGQIHGVFRSGSWHKAEWVAARNPAAQLPDPFTQTKGVDGIDLANLRFRDLDGAMVGLDTAGTTDGVHPKCRIIEVFGSWCPNCHDAADLLGELLEKHGPSGLSVTGLAFEMTGDVASDTEQIQRYIARKKVSWPVYLAGTSDKILASKAFPLVDRIRSFPTFVFLDRHGKIRAVYTGFSGPATGEAHTRLRNQFESIIQSCLE